MKFEKLNENKIRITLSIHDLEEKDISFHDFMSNSIENQDLFLDMLEKAEEQIGFKAQDCKIKVEALAMTENDFIVTITKVLPEINKKGSPIYLKKKPKIKRKINNINSSQLIYKFNTFDDYCNFIEFLIYNNLEDAIKIADKILIYLYNNNYYLVLNNLNTTYNKISTFLTSITEFASYVIEPNLFICRLTESGTLFVKNNAFKKSFIHFLNAK